MSAFLAAAWPLVAHIIWWFVLIAAGAGVFAVGIGATLGRAAARPYPKQPTERGHA